MLIAQRRSPITGGEKQSGFTMIEVLITFVVLAIGVLGIVSLLVGSKTSQFEAMQRSRAISIADTIVERIRSNPQGMATYNIGLTPRGTGTAPSEPSPNCTGISVCTAAQLATHDLWQWDQLLRGAAVTITSGGSTEDVGGLPEVGGCITFAPNAGKLRTGQLTVLIQWRGLQSTFDGVDATTGIVCIGDPAGDDENRRQIVVNTFVADQTEGL